MFEVKVVTHFSAAHQLKMVAEKCESLHGHNWRVEVYLTGDKLSQAGVLMDFGEIKKHVADIMSLLDHKFLNETQYFGDDHPPSSENIARHIAVELQTKIKDPEIKVSRVNAWESDNARAAYIIDNPR